MSWRSLLPWMNNQTMLVPLQQPIVFEIEGFDILPGSGPFFFLLALLVYMLVLLGNGVVACVIVLDKKLHRPMFVMICHLVVCDLMGATAVLPHLMMDFLMGQKKIIYPAAISQAFCIHFYGTAVQTILGAMAYDRYVAVCEPLRYQTIMTSTRMHLCCALAWLVAFVLIAILFSFHLNVPLCGKTIQHVYCSNRGILNLACIPTPDNNLYGLSMTWSLSTAVFVIIAFSYIKILTVTLKQGRTDSSVRSKAFQTCSSHLMVYILFQIAVIVVIVSLRFPTAKNMWKFCSIMITIFPPAVNPIIYGLVSKELRTSIIQNFFGWVKKKQLGFRTS